jgi:prepilin-type N-terminal cleavage/methylation domain-containing protein
MNMQRTTTTTKVRRGVTVLELVIVVTMMGILAAFSLGKTSKAGASRALPRRCRKSCSRDSPSWGETGNRSS